MTERMPILAMADVTITRSNGEPLIRNLDLSLGAGDILAIVGKSGIGKSSVLNVIAGFIMHRERGRRSPWQWFDGDRALQYSGSVHVGGIEIDSLPPEKRRAIAMVMQGGVVYEHLSVLQNVAFPLRTTGNRNARDLRAQAARLLAEVELTRDGETVEHMFEDKAGQLSAGQRQRLALARAMAKDPDVYLLDEAFANLDPLLRRELYERFTTLIIGQPRCAAVVTHDLSDVSRASCVLLLGPAIEGSGHWLYRRDDDNALLLEKGRGGDSGYWQKWHAEITGAAAAAHC